ncbi:MAG: rhomboid family intramembrane serine protease [Alphaproteobacteria bacterium]|nr:MAG: rhomboid family intramembrane serine protease [Alphaproteobacteria bacterium]
MLPWSTSVAVRYTPFVTWALIVVNAIVFLFEQSLPPRALDALLVHYALVPARYFNPEWALANGLDPGNYLPFLTNTFMHAGWMHVILNMWSLLIFGPAVEDRLGPLRFLGFYLVCGVGASVAHGLVNSDSLVPALGASGAIAGVMGAFMRLFPLSRVVVLVPVIFLPFFFELHAFFFVGFWMALQLMQGLAGLFDSNTLGGVAWWAHIGGFAVGWLAIGWLQLTPVRYRPPQPDEGRFGFAPDGRRRRKGPWS